MRSIGPLLVFALCACISDGYRILAVFPQSGRSHFVFFDRLTLGLAERGHRVDVVSPFVRDNPPANYKDVIRLPMLQELSNNLRHKEIRGFGNDSLIAAMAFHGCHLFCEWGLGNPELKRLLDDPPKDPPYDLVIIPSLTSNCLSAIGHKLNVPVVGVTTTAAYPWGHEAIANPENLAISPNTLSSLSGRMNFWERVYNFLHANYNKALFKYMTYSEEDEITRRHLGADMPPVRELEKRIALILSNTHMTLNGVRPTTPALVEVGGLHIKEDDTELPADLKKWLDDSKHGVVYFSFGSMLKIESFPARHLKIFYDSLGKIAPVRVLMKIAKPEELPSHLPGNVLTSTWLPQQKVLRHPNVKAFITHGGLLSVHEAVYFGVPMIGMPMFADQFMNMNMCVERKIAVKLYSDTLTEEDMSAALNTVLNDPAYRRNIKMVSAMFRDRPLNALDTAIYWTEYVIKHGPESLRSNALELNVWQRSLLDVYGFLLICLLVVLHALRVVAKVIFKILKAIVRRIFPSPRSRVQRSKKVN